MTLISRERRAARVLLLDNLGRVLLIKGHDADEPDRQWWFTIGGGIEANEDAPHAAVRELFEETGVTLTVKDLEGPVLKRSAIFDFAAEHVLQHEDFFVARITAPVTLSRSGWTELEKSFVDDLRWLSVEELKQSPIEVFPENLANIVENLGNGWDGTVQLLGLEHTSAHIKKAHL